MWKKDKGENSQCPLGEGECIKNNSEPKRIISKEKKGVAKQKGNWGPEAVFAQNCQAQAQDPAR